MDIKQLVTAGLIAGVMALPAASQAGEFKQAVKDSVITTKIKAEMAKEKGVSATHIRVDTDANGVVQLGGTAKSQAEVEKAVSIASNTKGVTSVDNQIKVDPNR